MGDRYRRFVPTQDYTGELFARWFQFAAFNPLFRSHGRDWRLHLPWGWTKGEIGYQETLSYHPDPKDLDNPPIEPICKKYLELRYQMMPYLYSAIKESCETGMPLIRAPWLHYRDDAAAVARGDEYLYPRQCWWLRLWRRARLRGRSSAARRVVRLLDTQTDGRRA